MPLEQIWAPEFVHLVDYLDGNRSFSRAAVVVA
jgi:hypothetical protein